METKRGRGRPVIGTPEEAAERRRRQTAERVRRLRERRRVEAPSLPASEPVVTEAVAPPTPTTVSPGIAELRLRYFVERIERLEQEVGKLRTRNPALADAYATERRGVQAMLKDAWAEVEASGFSADVTREIIRLRKMPVEERRVFEDRVSLYKRALGME